MIRHGWADLAKATCIVLVVIHHVLYDLVSQLVDPAPGWWFTLDGILTPLRIPVFFVISGWLAVGAINRDWSASIRPRITRLYAIYLAWLVFAAAIYLAAQSTTVPGRYGTWNWLPLNAVLANSAGWYLYALVVYFALAKVLRKWPVATLLIAAALSIASSEIVPESMNFTPVLRNAVFFLAGAFLAHLVTHIAAWNLWWQAIPAASVYALVAGIAVKINLTDRVEAGADFALSLLAVPVGIMVASWAATASARVSRGGSWLGARTLPIYVMHLPLLAVLDIGLEHVAPLRTLFGVAAPLLVAAVLVTVSLLIYAATKTRVPWLYSPKAPWPVEREPARA